MRRQGQRVRINAQLIDAISGNHIWAERYDRELGDIFAVQDEITAAVARAVLPAVSDAEIRRILRKPRVAIALGKELFYRQAELPMAAAYEAARERTSLPVPRTRHEDRRATV